MLNEKVLENVEMLDVQKCTLQCLWSGLIAPWLESLLQDTWSETGPNKICSLYFLGMLLAFCYKTNNVHREPTTSICISFLPLTVCLMHKVQRSVIYHHVNGLPIQSGLLSKLTIVKLQAKYIFPYRAHSEICITCTFSVQVCPLPIGSLFHLTSLYQHA